MAEAVWWLQNGGSKECILPENPANSINPLSCRLTKFTCSLDPSLDKILLNYHTLINANLLCPKEWHHISHSRLTSHPFVHHSLSGPTSYFAATLCATHSKSISDNRQF